MNGKTFREAVCERAGIEPGAYEHEVLWRCFFPAARWLGKLLWRLRPGYFKDELELLRNVGDCLSVAEVRVELNYHRNARPLRGLGRRLLHLRVSGRRLIRLAAAVMQ